MVLNVSKERDTLTFNLHGLFGADEGNVFILNMNYLANDTASHHSGMESSTV
jgi:hypothetical protein